MFTDKNVAFIGGGIMGEAMIRGLITQNIVAPNQIYVADPLPERLDDLRQRYEVRVTTSNAEAAEAGQVIVMSVKPQNLADVMPGIRGHLRRQDLLLSILAGTPIRKLADGVAHAAVVRAMPNTPAQIGMGMTVWTGTPEVTEMQRGQAQAILGALGTELYVNDEGYLDMATALSGTGPAYIFLFMEALIDAGVHLGFSRKIAEQLVLQTMAGSVEIARQSDLHPAQLRNMVTSPGGTSAEALYELEKGALRTILSKAVWAAYRKSKYLGDLSEKHGS